MDGALSTGIVGEIVAGFGHGNFHTCAKKISTEFK
jgi:hypothetical protein